MFTKKIIGVSAAALLSLSIIAVVTLSSKATEKKEDEHNASVSVSDNVKVTRVSENYVSENYKDEPTACEDDMDETDETDISEVTETGNTEEEKKAPENEEKKSAGSESNSSKRLFNTKKDVEDYVNSKVAENSPLTIGYKAAGYDRLYGDYCKLGFTEKGFICTLSDEHAFRSNMAMRYRDYTSYNYTYEEVTRKKLNENELSELSRLFDYINKTVGKDNYYIYDVYEIFYKEEFTNANGSKTFVKGTNDVTVPNYIAEIVPKEYYEKYKELNYRKDDFVVSFEICNDCLSGGENEQHFNAEIFTEYPLFKKSHEQFDSFMNEVYEKCSDCAVGFGNVSYLGDNCISIMQPVTSWIKKSLSEDEKFYQSHMEIYTIKALPECIDSFSDKDLYLSVAFYFKPGTSQDEALSHLRELYPIIEKYNVLRITADILNREDDFARYRNSKGYISDQVIDSYFDETMNPSFRYLLPHSNDFSPWGEK